MKKVLGLDLGTTSIGWAFVHEAESSSEESKIIKLGVRVNPLTTDEQQDFEKGKSITVNADRTLKRSARRNLQRFKIRRHNLIEVLKDNKIITDTTILTEVGKNTTYETLALRAKSATQEVTKEEFSRILLMLNKKRGYKSSRKTSNDEEGQAVDGMDIAKYLYENDLTPGQYCYEQLKKGRKVLPDFYRSDLENELDNVWQYQKQLYPELLTEDLFKEIERKNGKATWAICAKALNLVGIKRSGNSFEKKIENYKWRNEALSRKLDLEQLGMVLQEINNSIYNSSGYLGAISDRSKELYFKKLTVGQYLYNQILDNRHSLLKKQVFYRQDYLDEFECIWQTQAQYHKELTSELKQEIRDVIIFYQRRLKSQKGLVSFCEFESKKVEIEEDEKVKTKIIGSRVCPKSSPLFQEFKIWQNLSNLEFQHKKTKEIIPFIHSESEEKELLFEELNRKGTLKKSDFLKIVGLNSKEWDSNYSELQGNRTNELLYEAYQNILIHSGHEINISAMDAKESKKVIQKIFVILGINPEILEFKAELSGKSFETQKGYLLWHLLYSYEGDNSNTGNEKLYEKLKEHFGIDREYAQSLINIKFVEDYGSLSTKAIRKIIPFIKENRYNVACELAGYNHSHSMTKEENEKRELLNKLELLPKNSLRNPVVEKILNQLVNVVNTIIQEPNLGKPDEIRIELARELKKSAKERAAATKSINTAKVMHDEIRKLLQKEFYIPNPTRNDIIKYKLYKELSFNGYHTLYSNTYIKPEKLFSKEIDVEHIIPKARLFDDSFSNKTLEIRDVNLKKSDETAYDFVKNNFGEVALEEYVHRVERFYKDGKDAFDNSISKAKYKKLLMKGSEIGEGFIERDLRESQYIAKKAKQMLLEICRTVLSTSGSITDKLREDWDLVNVMKELNLPKYKKLGLTKIVERKDGQQIEQIIDWTKRNDHRHHAMDALTVAFTKHNHIQYLNNLHARKDEADKKHGIIIAIEQKETFKAENGKRLFKPPMINFRTEAKNHLKSVLISHKAKNKVVTINKNKITGSSINQIALTPRGQLHKETVYGKSSYYETKEVKIGSSFDEHMIEKVCNLKYREALLNRLIQFDRNSQKAFTGQNSLAKNPIYTIDNQIVPEKIKIVWLENHYTIRKDIDPDLKIEKVIDVGIRNILHKRLDEYGGKAKEAFVNLDKNPIWLNKEKGISIKRVTITGVSNAEPLHAKRDHLGNEIIDDSGNTIANDFVSTGNNHHVAIYRDQDGNLQEEVVSLFEAVARVNSGMPIIDKNHTKGWEFLFSMKQNEMFVFPSADFDPKEIDLLNPENYKLISKNLFRVQTLSIVKYGNSTIRDFKFKHHLETLSTENKIMKGITYQQIKSLDPLTKIVKVRLNHIGQIVSVGEY